jgi:hypothetical protein
MFRWDRFPVHDVSIDVKIDGLGLIVFRAFFYLVPLRDPVVWSFRRLVMSFMVTGVSCPKGVGIVTSSRKSGW